MFPGCVTFDSKESYYAGTAWQQYTSYIFKIQCCLYDPSINSTL